MNDSNSTDNIGVDTESSREIQALDTGTDNDDSGVRDSVIFLRTCALYLTKYVCNPCAKICVLLICSNERVPYLLKHVYSLFS